MVEDYLSTKESILASFTELSEKMLSSFSDEDDLEEASAVSDAILKRFKDKMQGKKLLPLGEAAAYNALV